MVSSPPNKLYVLVAFFIMLFAVPQANAQFQLNGDATIFDCHCYELTEDQAQQVSAVWNVNTIDLTAPYDMTFEINLGCNDGGADGMVFGFQSVGPVTNTGVATAGQGMGLGGVSPSLGIFIDTYQNTIDNDPVADHISLNSNGVTTHNGGVNDLVGPNALANIEDCMFHDFRVVWNPATLTLQVYLDGNLVLTYTGDIVNNIFGGNPNVHWGFAGATGGLTNVQQFCTQLEAGFNIDNTEVCVGQAVSFLDTSVAFGGVTNLTWDFGDGSPIVMGVAAQSHTYMAAGSYTVTLTIEDILGCVDTETIVVTVGDPTLDITATPANICPGQMSQLDATVIPVAAPTCEYTLFLEDTYSDGWNGGSLDVLADGMNIGNFTFFSGPNATLTFTAPNGADISLIYNGGASDAEVSYTFLDANNTVISSAGPGLTAGTTVFNGILNCGSVPANPYNFTWTADPTLSATNINNPTASPTANGVTTYTLTANDPITGCTATNTVNVTISNVTASEVVTDEDCLGANDGMVVITGAGGLMPYTYDIGLGMPNQTGTFGSLASGNYNYTVTDDAGCSTSGTFTVGAGTFCCVMTNTTAFTDPQCNSACDGTITLTEMDGFGVVTYSIDNGMTTQTTGVFTGLCAGVYDVLIQDGMMCTFTAQITLTDPPVLSASITSQTDVDCDGNCNGSVDIAIVGGTSPYMSDIGTGPQASTTFTNLCAGAYNVVVTDANNCTFTLPVTINPGNTIALNVNSVTDDICGQCIGQVDLDGSGTATTFMYDIGNGPQAGNVFTNLCDGMYTATVTDPNGCATTTTFNVANTGIVTAGIIAQVDETCNGSCDGQVTLDIQGGLAPFQYSLDNCVTLQASPTFNMLCAGNYTACVVDANGCSATIPVTILAGPDSADATINPVPALCVDAPPAILTGASPGGTWSGVGVTGASFDPAVAGPGTFNVVYTIPGACGDVDDVDIVVNDLPTVTFISDKAEGCLPLSVVFAANNLTTNCTWDFGDGTTANDCGPVTHTYTTSGLFDVSLTITDANGCMNTMFQDDFIEVHPLPAADFTSTPQFPSSVDSEVTFRDLSIGAASWDWDIGGLANLTDQDPVFNFDTIGAFPVTLTVTSPNGCLDSITRVIQLAEDLVIYTPNAFTPNGDDLNAVFRPYIKGIEESSYELTIFSRWGDVVFQSKSQALGWDGMIGDKPISQGVYVWMVKVRDNVNGDPHEFTGHVTVIQ